MFRLNCFVIGYFIGCISISFILGKIVKTDFRTQGSGNLGTTNVLRILGPKAGIFIFICDILKGVIPFWLCYNIFADPETGGSLMAGTFGGAGAIIGHIFPFYLKFKGGKGIATTIGVMVSVSLIHAPWLIPVVSVIGFSTAGISKYISLGSVLFMILIPIVLFITHFPIEGIILLSIISITITWKHRDNIQRLLNGTERKLSFTKRSTD